MLKYLIQVVQNALPGGILAGLLFAVVYREYDPDGRRRLVWSLGAGVFAALVLAVLRRNTRLINREFVNITVLSAMIVLVFLFVPLVWGALRKRQPRLRTVLLEWTGSGLLVLLLFYTLPTIFLYPPEFALPGQGIFTTDFLFKLAGFCAGLFVVFFAVLALFKSSRGVPLVLIRSLLTASLAVNLVNQVSTILQFLLARRLITAPRWVFRSLVRIINYNAVFLYILMALSIVVPLLLFILSLKPVISYRNPAEKRKFRARKRDDRRWSAAVVCTFIAAVLFLTVVKTYNERGVTLTPAEEMTIAGGDIIIPIEKIQDGHLHRFNYTAADNIEMRFIVIKKNEVSYGVGLDACDICGPTGYYERKDGVVCRLCDVVMNISTIGFKGGCNPVPLAYTLKNGTMVIERVNLENERTRFK
jgi:uncharacterized membrane protein